MLSKNKKHNFKDWKLMADAIKYDASICGEDFIALCAGVLERAIQEEEYKLTNKKSENLNQISISNAQAKNT